LCCFSSALCSASSDREAASLIMTIMGVSEACQSPALMHRDLKPGSLLFHSVRWGGSSSYGHRFWTLCNILQPCMVPLMLVFEFLFSSWIPCVHSLCFFHLSQCLFKNLLSVSFGGKSWEWFLITEILLLQQIITNISLVSCLAISWNAFELTANVASAVGYLDT